jgi:hypothetical protein
MPENDESRLAVAMAKMVADHMHCLEKAVRWLVPRMEVEVDNTPIRDAVQWLRRAGAEQQLCLTSARLEADFGWSGAARTAAPVCGLERRTDEGRARVTEGEGSGADPAARDAIQRG